jgi:acyl-CoA synthetase (AMP-forming)/AMP-acid ligase II/acyl carrier protein
VNDVPAPATVLDVLTLHGLLQPSAPAVGDCEGRVLSYGLLHREVGRFGASLAGVGIGRDGRVATVMPDGLAAAIATLGAMSFATCVPLDPSLDDAACRALLATLRVDALIVPADEQPPAVAAAQALGIPVVHLRPALAEDGTTIELLPIDGTPRQTPARPPRADDLALVLHTSGTTAQPKAVPLTHAQLIARAQASPLTRSDRGLCAVPMFTASAIEAYLVATLLAGASVTFLRTFDAARVGAGLDRLQPTYLYAGPAVLASLLEAVAGRRVVVPKSLRLLRTGAAPLQPALQTALEANLGIPVMQGYGLTETGAIARNPLPPAPRPAGSVGKPLFPGVAILAEDNAIGPWHAIGEVVVRGPGVMTGYENNAEANRLAFHDGWFRTGDLGRFDADGYLFLTGRIRELINRGGLKVSPADVDAAMLQHAAVLEAATFAVPHPSLGEDVAVAVVLRRPGCVGAPELRLHALQHLAPFKVPSTVVIVGALPKNASGKIDRGALAHALRDALRPAFQAPRDADEARVAEIFAAVLKQSAVGAHDNFFELGGDSLSAMQVVARVNAAFRIVLPVRSLFEAPTAALFAEAARKVRTVA